MAYGNTIILFPFPYLNESEAATRNTNRHIFPHILIANTVSINIALVLAQAIILFGFYLRMEFAPQFTPHQDVRVVLRTCAGFRRAGPVHEPTLPL